MDGSYYSGGNWIEGVPPSAIFGQNYKFLFFFKRVGFFLAVSLSSFPHNLVYSHHILQYLGTF
jgi:hypothetical protein